MTSTTHQQIKALIIDTIAEAEEQGLNSHEAARRAFPLIPESVIFACGCEYDAGREDAWWESIERTIDGDVIRNAITTAGRS